MVIHEMTNEECHAMLLATRLVRLACARSNQPYIIPVNVDFENDYLYGYATLGQKIEWMRQNPLVCVGVDEVLTDGGWRSLVIVGRYEELPPTPDYEDARRVAERLFQQHPAWWEPAAVPVVAHDQRTRIVYRIRIDQVTGRRASPDHVRTARPREPI